MLVACLLLLPLALSGCGSSGSSPYQFNVMSANIWLGGKGDPTLDKIACYLSNADIAFLQEVDEGMARSGGLSEPEVLAQKTGLTHKAHTVWRPGLDGGNYVDVVILSRFPLTEIRFHKASMPGWDYHKETLFVHATATLPDDERVHLFATHYPLEAEGRQEASEVLRGLVDNVTGPVLFGGDLNATAVSLEIQRVTAKLSDSWNSAPQDRFHCGNRIDYVFYRGPYVVRSYEAACMPLSQAALQSYEHGCSIGNADLSDHPFVYVKFQVAAS